MPTEKNSGQVSQQQNSADPTGIRRDAIVWTHAQQLRKRRRIMQGAVICAAVNAALSVAAVLTHQYALTTVCLILTPLIYTILILLLLMLVQSPGATRPRTRPH